MSKRIISLILSIVMILLIIPPATYSAQAASYESELKSKGFKDSYIPSLLALHEKYPKWTFEPLIVGENFSTAISKERQNNGHAQQLIQKWSDNEGKGYYCTCSSCYVNGQYKIREGKNWVAASQSAVEFYLDPRNFLNEKYIFQFESTQYNTNHTQQGVEYILSGTWLYNTDITYKDANGNTITYKNSNGQTVKYSKAIMEAAKYSNMSAYYLASKIKQEVGGVPQAQAGGASGTNSTYPGIYNLYNIGATTGALDGLKWAYGDYRWIHISVTYNGKAYNGYIREDLVVKKSDGWYTNTTCKLRKGPSTSTDILTELSANKKLTYIETVVTSDADTYNRPWTNPYLSIYNGAKWIANNFSTQFTGYLQKFNVNPASGSSMHSHEYMTNVQGAASEASHTYNAYKNMNMLSDAMNFVIPVFENMAVGDNLTTPAGITVSNTATGVNIKWDSVAKAEKYRVFYRIGNGAWTKITDTASTNYTWTGAKSGTTYTFTVRCVNSAGTAYTSSFDAVGKNLTYIAAPTISSVSVENTGTVIKWNAVGGAAKYRVFYKTASSDWIKLTDTTSTSFTWTGAKSNTNYTFTVRCINSAGTAYTSSYDAVGKSIKYVAAPKLTAVSNGPYGIQITWGAVAGAEKYRVFYRIGNGAWTKITDTTATTYAWLSPVSGTNYTFTVRCVNSTGNAYTSGFDTVGKSLKYIAAPKITSVSTLSSAIQIDWTKSVGAEKYRVFYKTPTTDWIKIADTTSTSFVWTGAKGGTNYTFTVRCVNKAGTAYTSGYFAAGTSIGYLATPKLTSVTAGNSGTVISWGKVSGAEKYRVFYKTASGSWTKLADTTSTSYTWANATKGTNYSYTVRCVSKDGKTYLSGYDTVGKSLKTVATPTLNTPEPTANGVNISWGSVAGVEKYRVFYKTASGDWIKLTDTTSTSYTWTGAKSNTNYTFTVRCVNSAGTAYTSGYNTVGKSIKYVATPKLTAVSNGLYGVQITWGAVAGAEKYRVFYRIGSGAWTKITDTTATTYAWLSPVSGTNYTFTVRCVNSAGNAYTSGFDAVGKSIKYIAAPKITNVSTLSSAIKIDWTKSVGAEKYRVFYKTPTTDWIRIADTTSTSFTWTGAKSGNTYTFTVRCVNSAGNAYTSGYNPIGVSIAY